MLPAACAHVKGKQKIKRKTKRLFPSRKLHLRAASFSRLFARLLIAQITHAGFIHNEDIFFTLFFNENIFFFHFAKCWIFARTGWDTKRISINNAAMVMVACNNNKKKNKIAFRQYAYVYSARRDCRWTRGNVCFVARTLGAINCVTFPFGEHDTADGKCGPLN